MAEIADINTQGNGSHLCIDDGNLVVRAGQAIEGERWKLINVPGAAHEFTIQYIASQRYIQIKEDGVGLVNNVGLNCKLTLSNGIANNTRISNGNLRPPLFLGVDNNNIVIKRENQNPMQWNIVQN